MVKTIHYIVNYRDPDEDRILCTQPSVLNKAGYIRTALKRAGYRLNIYSTAEGDINSGFNPILQKKLDENETIYYPITFGRSNLLLKVLSRIVLHTQLLYYFLFNIQSKDIVLVYHSLVLTFPIKVIRRLFNRKIYFEVEEIYAAVYREEYNYINKEIKYLQDAGGYIVVNDIIKDKCNLKERCAVCYGQYNASKFILRQNNNNLINIVYAGVIGKKGSDAFLAVDIANYLSDKYRIFILGYGKDTDIHDLKSYIDESNGNTKCKVSYEGCLSGEEYLSFLSKCHIGLCTRILEDEFSDYTFPSKVLAYISNNIVPICTPINCIKESKISEYVVFSNQVSPESISKAIQKADLSIINKYHSLLNSLDMSFINDLKLTFN